MSEEQQYRVPADMKGATEIAFGSQDGTTHKLRPDDDGIVTVKNAEDVAHLEGLGFHKARAEQPQESESAAKSAPKKGA